MNSMVLTLSLLLPAGLCAQSASTEYRAWVSAYEKGDHSRAYDVGFAFYHGIYGAPHDYRKAAEWFSKAAEKGSAPAAVMLGDMYSNGKGVKADAAAAAGWYRRAADKDYAQGQAKLAGAYYNGEGVKRDMAAAALLYGKACESGQEGAPCSRLGQMYMLGEGVKPDHQQALEFLLRADSLGDKGAQVHVAEIYRAGLGSKPDLAKAADWLRRGANLGDPVAMKRLAEAYSAGEGVNRDYTEAYRWLSVVTAGDHDPAAEKMLESVSGRLKPGELASAKQKAAESVKKFVTKEDRDNKEYVKKLKGR